MGLPYIGPTLHEEPPDLFGVGVSHEFRVCRHVRRLSKSFHNLRFSAINFYVGRRCAASGVVGVGTTYVGNLCLPKIGQDGGLQAGSGHV